MKFFMFFKIRGFVVFHGQNWSLGMMDWSFKFSAIYIVRLKESQIYWFPNLIRCKNMLVVERWLYLVWVWVLGNGINSRMLHIVRMKGHLLGKIQSLS